MMSFIDFCLRTILYVFQYIRDSHGQLKLADGQPLLLPWPPIATRFAAIE